MIDDFLSVQVIESEQAPRLVEILLPVLNKGDKGDKGDRGDKGDTGADSQVPGPRGAPGNDGVSIKGDKGDQGEAGDTAVILGFPIVAASSFNAPHSFNYNPRVTLVTPDGEEVETDTKHLPGQVVLLFPSPFSGFLTLA